VSKSLKISDELSLPVDAVTQAVGWLGRRGSGKTYGATKLAELLQGANAQFVAIDPVGVWWGLRLAANGKDPGLDIPIFGGLHGDIPLEATAGAMLADVIVDRGISAVLDVSQFEADADRTRFATDFAARFFHRKKSVQSAVHVFVEEAQEFIPQNIQRGEEKMLHAWQRMIRLGRNFGIGVSLISQRPQDVNKKALNQTECLFCFQLTGPQERKAVEDWVSDKGLKDDLGRILPELRQGRAHVWSPVWLEINREVLIAEKWTFAAGSTPKVGARPVETRPLAPIEMEKLRTDMAATIERAKADDPKALRAELAKVKAELQRLANAKPETKVVKEPIITDAQMKEFTSAVKLMESAGKERIAAAEELASSGRELIQKAGEFAQAMARATNAPRPAPVAIRQPAARPSPNLGPIHNVMAGGEISGPERRILNAIAWFESIGVVPPAQPAVAFLAGYTYGGGGFNNPKGALRSKGLIRYVGDGLELTDEGKGLAVYPELSPTNAELHRKVLEILPNPEQRILKPLLERYPDAINNEDLAHAAGYKFGTGGFNNPRGRLRTLGLIEYRDGGVAARSILFPQDKLAAG
jgi:hypothetical protein